MACGNVADGDYFIDCNGISQSALRAIFGVWINICVVAIAFSIRSIYRSTIVQKLQHVSKDSPTALLPSLWRISPPTTLLEAGQLCFVILQSLLHGDVFYCIVALVCIIAALVSVTGTTIANHAVPNNMVMWDRIASGILVTRDHNILVSSTLRMKSRVEAFERAGAPLNELFDFIPDDSLHWIYKEEQWNNSWTGTCTFHNYSAVNLTVFPLNGPFQSEIPALGKCLPSWAVEDPAIQGFSYTGYYMNANINGTGSWRDILVTYAFGNASSNSNSSSTVNFAFANFLAHNVGRNSSTQRFIETSFRSDVHVAECAFNNASPGAFDQTRVDGGEYNNVALNIASIYAENVVESSTAGLPVIQPTGEQMFRYFQAFLSVKDSAYVHTVQRTLSASQSIVQLRLSSLVCTTAPFFISVIIALGFYCCEPCDRKQKRLLIPSSQLDWTVQAAREHFHGDRGQAFSSSIVYVKERIDLSFRLMEDAITGQSRGRITSLQGATNPSPRPAFIHTESSFPVFQKTV